MEHAGKQLDKGFLASMDSSKTKGHCPEMEHAGKQLDKGFLASMDSSKTKGHCPEIAHPPNVPIQNNNPHSLRYPTPLLIRQNTSMISNLFLFDRRRAIEIKILSCGVG